MECDNKGMGIESKKSRGVALSHLLASQRLSTLGALWGGGEWPGIGHTKAKSLHKLPYHIYTRTKALEKLEIRDPAPGTGGREAIGHLSNACRNATSTDIELAVDVPQQRR